MSSMPDPNAQRHLDEEIAVARQRYRDDRTAVQASETVVADLVRRRRRLRRRIVLRKAFRITRWTLLVAAVICGTGFFTYGVIQYFTLQPGSGDAFKASAAAWTAAAFLRKT
ncbi:hypothetical protein OG713_19930 [Streptomyces sp. NBC_00723]|uniref:hypothetical protein n=1 Tax=Streptomyces sp. NBC_00723 TaxID=2903673 RepID=UPI0038647974